MTSIVNFEERIISPGRISDVIFNSLERLHDAKLNGVLLNDELSKIIKLEGSIFCNQVSKGIKSEDEIDLFMTQLPRVNCFSHSHENLDVTYKIINEDINAALYKQDVFIKQSKPVKRI